MRMITIQNISNNSVYIPVVKKLTKGELPTLLGLGGREWGGVGCTVSWEERSFEAEITKENQDIESDAESNQLTQKKSERYVDIYKSSKNSID